MLNREQAHGIYAEAPHQSRTGDAAAHRSTKRPMTHRRDVTCSDVLLSFQSRSQLELQPLLVLV